MPIEPLGPVVVGVDGSAESSAALDLAAEEAAGRVTPLIVVHAYPRRHASAVVAACAPEWVDAVAARRRLLSVAAGRVAAEHPCLAVEGELVAGDPAEALIARSAQACLVVVGHRGGAALDGVPIGWVAMRVAARAAAPVVVHRPLDRHTGVESPRPVLVGVDVLGGTDSPVEFAFAEAALRGAPLVAMSVWSHPSGSYEQARGNAERMLSDAVRNWSEKYPEVPVRQVARYSLDTIRSLREVSTTAQLVVVGRSRHTGLARLLLGSVSHGLVQSAGCPVAIVP